MVLQKIFRIAELLICVFLIVLWFTISIYATRVMIVCGTVFGFTIITAVLVALSFVTFNDVPVYLCIGAVLFLICSGLSLATLPVDADKKMVNFIAIGFFIANAIIFLIDFIFEIKNNKAENP